MPAAGTSTSSSRTVVSGSLRSAAAAGRCGRCGRCGLRRSRPGADDGCGGCRPSSVPVAVAGCRAGCRPWLSVRLSGRLGPVLGRGCRSRFSGCAVSVRLSDAVVGPVAALVAGSAGRCPGCGSDGRSGSGRERSSRSPWLAVLLALAAVLLALLRFCRRCGSGCGRPGRRRLLRRSRGPRPASGPGRPGLRSARVAATGSGSGSRGWFSDCVRRDPVPRAPPPRLAVRRAAGLAAGLAAGPAAGRAAGLAAGLGGLDGVDQLALAHAADALDAQTTRHLLELGEQHAGEPGRAALAAPPGSRLEPVEGWCRWCPSREVPSHVSGRSGLVRRPRSVWFRIASWRPGRLRSSVRRGRRGTYARRECDLRDAVRCVTTRLNTGALQRSTRTRRRSSNLAPAAGPAVSRCSRHAFTLRCPVSRYSTSPTARLDPGAVPVDRHHQRLPAAGAPARRRPAGRSRSVNTSTVGPAPRDHGRQTVGAQRADQRAATPASPAPGTPGAAGPRSPASSSSGLPRPAPRRAAPPGRRWRPRRRAARSPAAGRGPPTSRTPLRRHEGHDPDRAGRPRRWPRGTGHRRGRPR